MGSRRKSYTPAYRRDAARLVIDSQRSIAEVAREIGPYPRIVDTGCDYAAVGSVAARRAS